MRKVLARFPDEQTQPTLWLFPSQGVYLTHKDSLTAIRICSIKQYQANHKVLVEQGWILEKQDERE
jgi:hypothetical protein